MAMSIQQIRAKRPEWSDLDDMQVVGVLRQTYYPDLAEGDIASAIGVKLPEAPAPKRTVLGTVGDIGVSLAKTAVSVPELAVGLADLPTGGRAGKAVESAGVRFKETQEILDGFYSDAQQVANRKVAESQGVKDTFVAALQNPSVIGHTAIQSLGAMGAGGVVGRGALALAPRIGGVAAAALGEGVASAGAAAEQIRQQTDDGLLTGGQAGAAVATGAGVGAFGAIGGKLAQAMGFRDIDTMIVQASRGPGASQGIVRRVLQGAATEGVLEELPQSIHEQVMQNLALDRPIEEGVDHAAVLGMLTGATMGGAANAFAGGRPATAPPAAQSGMPVPALPPPTISVDGQGEARTADQRQAARNEAGGIVETGAFGQGRGSEPTFGAEQMPPGLPPPAVEVDPAGNAATVEQRQQLREAGPLARAADLAASSGQVLDVEARPVESIASEIAPVAEPIVEPAPMPSIVAPAAPLAKATSAPAAPAAPDAPAFETYEQADEFRREQRARGSTVQALPVPSEAGFRLAVKGDPEYAAGETLRDERRKAVELAKARAAAGVLDGDITNRLGMPFTVRLPAMNAAKKAGEGFEVVPVKGGFVVRKGATDGDATGVQRDAAGGDRPGRTDAATGLDASVGRDGAPAGASAVGERAPAAEDAPGERRGQDRAVAAPEQAAAAPGGSAAPAIEGKAIDAEWTAFNEQSGTLKVPRAEMPQIKAEHRGAMVNFMRGRGIAHAEEEVTAASLKPTQAEFSPGKVAKAKAYEGGNRAILVSRDGHVLDGHHQWMAAREAGEAVRAIRLDAPIRELLDAAREFPSAETSGGAAAVAAGSKAAGGQSAAGAAPAPQTPDRAKVAPGANKIFTEEAAAAARARMKKKLATLGSGIDPELLQDGITLAGYHIERGARSFAAYARAMLDDMGENVRPYLKQLYMALKFDPRAKALEGLDSAAAVEAADLDLIEPAAAIADTEAKEAKNAARELDSAGPGALEGASSQDVRPAGEGGHTGEGADGGGRRDGGADARADEPGRDLAGGVGAGEGDVPVPARGTRARSQKAAKPRVSRVSRADAGAERLRPEPQGLSLDFGPNEAPNAPSIAAPQIAAEDFTIDDDVGLGEGGQKTKFKNNVAAIRLLQDLESSGRLATPDEQRVLARYVGWGGLPQAFDASNADWSREHAELKELLSEQDLADARRSTRYAHYTSRPIIVDGIYAALRRFGFTGGKTLEAGAGVGNFLGLMPADMRSAGRFTAIEREPLSSAIARHLYPRQIVQRADFTEFKGNDGYFDAAVGNPPFARDTQTDRSGRKHLSGLSLHNYFFAKAVDMLREGGVMAQVVTNSFLDAKADAARRYISDRTVFLGAIRLPNNAFAKNANTEVTTDIIFLQKRPDAEIGGRAARQDGKRWLDTGSYTDRQGKEVALNRYFIDHPEMMLGDFGAFGTMYGPDQPALVQRDGQDTLALLKEAVGRLPEGVYRSIADTGTAEKTKAAIVALRKPTVHEGGYFLEDGKLMQRLPDLGGEARGTEITPATQWTEKTTLGESGFARIKALAGMRGTLRGLIAAEMADDDKGMGQLRAKLNEEYDAYRKDHGLINDPSTLRVFDDDPDYPLLASLEHGYVPGIGPAAAKRQGIKPTKSSARKGPIFERRVVAARSPVSSVSTPADALAVSMAERGRLDAGYIGKLLNRDADDVLRELSTGDTPLLFRDPATDEFVLRDAYLSGNVRAKLAQARAAGLSANARALEEVQPEDVGASEIVARVGSPWVPEAVYEDFATRLFGEGTTARVRYLKTNSGYQVDVVAGSDVALRTTWGTAKMDGGQILAALLNNRAIKVTYRDSEGKTHTDQEATEQANAKAQEIREAFSDWLFADGERSERLVRAYNDTNNNYVTRIYDGSMMSFPGKVPDEIIKFRRHQRNAIARIVQDRTGLLDHVVGAGKTFTVVAGAMELKRTGLANKPMVAVPNHLVKQWAADFYRLYPGANILTATKKDFERENRRKFLAKIATGDWDAVVIAHSSFGFIKPAPEFEAAFNQSEVDRIVATINEVEDGDGDKLQKKRTVKQLEALKERLENRIRALRDKPMDDLLDFEQIGVDQLFVDEFHMFKNLMFSTKMQNVQGLGDAEGSQRAYDMYVKINQIYAKNGRDQGFVAATGTPVSNSLAEMYHMMRYLMPTAMRELGFESFDAWANTFASVEQVWMQKPSGDGYKASSRMSNFVNTPELLKMFDQVADTVTMDDIKGAYREENGGAEFPLPKLKGDRRQPVSLDKTPAQEAYMEDLAKRAAAVEARRGPPKKGEDNILVIMGDGRKAAMDIRLVDLQRTEREPGGRIDRASDEIMARYERFRKVKGTQLVFSDLGTPVKHARAELKEYEALRERAAAANEEVQASAVLGNEAAQAVLEDAEAAQAELDGKGPDWLDAVKAAERGFSVYDDLRAALMEKGIPEGEIAFIHDYNTDEQKASLFRKVNAGDIRVLIGSTAKMGAGTNAQERMVALHHLDVPWRPSDVEQREGRIIRQGNALMTELADFEVEILAYVTKDTLDMRMWQVQETKLKMINQLRTRKVGREIDNAFEDMELSAGEMQAAATGNIDLLHEIQLRADVKKLEQRRRSFDASRNELASRRRRNAERMAELPGRIESGAADARQVDRYKQEAQARLDGFRATIDGKEYTDWREAQAYLRELDERTVEAANKEGVATKRAAPISVVIDGETYTARAAMAEAFSELRGDADPIVWTVQGQEYRRRSRIASAIRQAVVDSIADQVVKPAGAIAGYEVSVESAMDKAGTVMMDVMLSRDGEVIAARDFYVQDSGKAPERVVSLVAGMVDSIPSDHRYQQQLLERAKKEQSELAATEDAGDWPDAGKLEAARLKHKEVLQRLAGAKKDGEAAKPDAPAFSRGESSGMEASAVRKAVDALVAKWANAPRVVVVQSMSDEAVPPAVRRHNEAQKSQGAVGEPEGFFYRGQVYLVADQLASTDDAMRVLLHESLGHYGLRGVFGESLRPILQQIAALRRGDVAAKAREYGLDVENHAERLMAAEEVLAEMAQTAPQLGYVQRAIAAIRSWLRANVAALRGMELSDAEILRDYLLPARGWVQRGESAPLGNAELAFARSPKTQGDYEARIDALFAGGKATLGTRVLDRSDVMGLLGHPDVPLMLNERHLLDGLTNHPEMTAQAWKKVPQWLDQPAAAYTDPNHPGRFTVVAPERLAGYPVVMAVEPAPTAAQRGKEQPFQLLVTVFAKTTGTLPPFGYLASSGRLRYADTKTAPVIWQRAGDIPRTGGQTSRAGRILTERHLAGFRRANPRSDGETPMFSRAAPEKAAGHPDLQGLNDTRDYRAKAQATIDDLFRTPGVVSWWHKSVGTMHNLAARSPAFKRVYDSVQNFLQDVSYYATEAADMAPRILPKLDRVSDIKKTALSAEDTKALSRPVFEGTLLWARDERGRLVKAADLEEARPGVVFTPAELKATFGLNDRQVSLYQEFRAAVDKSLTRLGASEMLRYGGKDVAAARDAVMEAGTATEAAALLRAHLEKAAKSEPARRDVLLDTAAKIEEKAERIEELISRGYAPLSRFGQYTLDVVDADGNRVYFGLFEGRLERGAMARRMRENFPDATVTMGTNSEQAHKLFNGVTPETLELFGEMVGMEAEGADPRHQLFQQYLKLAKSNRSAMKRLIERKGIAGFNEDAGRVLAGFIYSNARLTSQNLHQGDIGRAVNEIPKQDGQLKDMAVKLVDYVRNPQEEAQALRGMLFTQYLGGSLASAMVNATQPFAVTMPYLSQWGGARAAARQIKDALRDVMRKTTGDAALDAALKKAEAEGIVAPQEVHQLLAQARGQAALKSGDGTRAGDARAAAGNFLSKVGLVWGKPFSLAEQFNRRVSFIAAYRTAVENGIAEPAKFAEEAIADTQFVYNKGNKPQWARGPVGATVFTFKQYSISYVELLHRMATQGGPEGRKAAALMLAMLFLMSGAGGLPFMENAEDVVDGIAQRLGYSFSTKQARRKFLVDVLGEGAGEFVDSGVSGIPGMPIDVSGRLGMGKVVPGAGLLTKKESYGRDVAELLGPGADLAQRVFEGSGAVLDGRVAAGAGMMAPKAVDNFRKGVEMLLEGQYKDAKGRKVMDTDALDALVKMGGFQPTDVAKVQEGTFTTQRMVAHNRMVRAEFAADMAQAVYDKDYGAQERVREQVRAWNRRNPQSPIKLDMLAVRRRVIAMRQDKATRLKKSAPKAIRANVKAQLSALGT